MKERRKEKEVERGKDRKEEVEEKQDIENKTRKWSNRNWKTGKGAEEEGDEG